MFIRQCFRKKNGKRRAYWALVESYRTERGPRQRVIAWLGCLDEQGRLGVQQAAGGQGGAGQRVLFEETQPRWVKVDVSAVRVENTRQFGGPWLAWELIRRLRLDQFLQRVMPRGQEQVPWPLTALVLVIARLCELCQKLLDTGRSDLIEGNRWGA